MPQSRQLAAIMFTDIVGYTALMGNDEQKAFQLLKKNRQIQQLLIKQYNGTWIKELGDGVLASFQTVTDAVFCAGAIHKACNEVEGLKLRIGVHLGEVVFEDRDVFGDGVNIASRLQALAPVGGTFVSEAVYKNVINKKEVITEFIKEETLKNVSEPVKIYELKLKETFQPETLRHLKKGSNLMPANKRKAIFGFGALIILAALLSWYFLAYQKQTASSGNNSSEKSIAVLYFDNMSGDPEQEYFSDGVTEEIITHISKIKNIRVISRTSVLTYKGKPLNLKKIADELNVSSILEGSVRKSGNTIRITAQLIDARTDQHIWAETFDRELKDIFEIQSEIARSIAQKFEIKITPEANAKISQTPTDNVEAYDQFQKGKFFMYTKYANTFQEEDFEKAKKYFERAIQLDSGYAEAYAGFAELYDTRRNIKGNAFPNELLELKQKLARKALQLKPNSSFVNFAMAYALLHRTEPDIDSGFFFLKKALYLDPADPVNNSSLSADLSIILGLNSIAIPLNLRAIKADPLDPNIYAVLGHQYVMLGKYSEAKKALQTCLDLTNDQFQWESGALLLLTYLGDFDKVKKRLAAREGYWYSYVKSFLAANETGPNQVSAEHRNDIYILLAANRNKVLKDVIKRLEAEIEKGNNVLLYNYDWLATSYYFDVYREDPDFKRVLTKAKKIHENNLLKYGKIEIPD
jgi:adenylate cyclase